MVDGPSRRSRGFAFLYFETVATAKEAKEVLPNKSLNLQGVPKKTHFQNSVGATLHWLNHK